MKMKAASIPAGILLALCLITGAEAKAPEPIKTNIAIFGFDIRLEENDFQTYSSIIPRTLKKYLQNNASYVVDVKDDEIIRLSDAQAREDSTELLALMDTLSAKYPVPDLFIVGYMYRKEDTTYIDVIAYNSITGKSALFPGNTIETGVLLQNSMDAFSAKLGPQIELFEKENVKLLTPSPYTALYRAFTPISLGVNAGRMFIIGPWSDIYNTVWSVSPHLRYDSGSLIKNTGLIFNATFFSTDSEDKNVPSYSIMQVWDPCIDLEYRIPLFSRARLSITAGAGAAFTRTRFYLPGGGGPDNPIIADVKTINLSAGAACALLYDLGPFTLRAGSSYKRIFYTDKGLDCISIITGCDIHF